MLSFRKKKNGVVYNSWWHIFQRLTRADFFFQIRKFFAIRCTRYIRLRGVPRMRTNLILELAYERKNYSSGVSSKWKILSAEKNKLDEYSNLFQNLPCKPIKVVRAALRLVLVGVYLCIFHANHIIRITAVARWVENVLDRGTICERD